MADAQSRHPAELVQEAPRKMVAGFIRAYQKHIAPYKTLQCPYEPTCSQYGLEAVMKHGAVKGSLLTAYRILRCNPLSHGGYDPVP